MSKIDRDAVEAYLHHEAALLDAVDLDAWLGMFADDGVYWVPSRRDYSDPRRHVSIVYDDKARLTARVRRLLSGKEYAQEPPSVTCRQLSNLMLKASAEAPAEVAVTGVMVVYETRPNTAMQILPSHTSWRLRADDDRYEIVEKRVVLLDLDRYYENLTFIL